MNEVNIHLFNVRNGDSIVIEFVSDPNKYVVIDSNLIKINSNFINPAYEFLKSKKVDSISSLIVIQAKTQKFFWEEESEP